MSDALRDRLHTARRRQGWTQRELARRSGINYVTISRIETGVITSVTTDTLVALAKELAVSTDYLLGLGDGPDAQPGRRRARAGRRTS
jgi:transcriptional regulator with XRE-family HTH domain